MFLDIKQNIISALYIKLRYFWMNFSVYVFKHLKWMFHLIIITLRFFSADCLFETTEEVHFKMRILLLFSFSSRLSTNIFSTSWHQRVWTFLWTEIKWCFFKSKFLFFFNHFNSTFTSLSINVKLLFCNHFTDSESLRAEFMKSKSWEVVHSCDEFDEFDN